MIPYAQLKPGPGFELDRALLYFAQRSVGLPVARRAVSRVIAAALRRRLRAAPPRVKQPGHERVLSDLRRDGLAMLPSLASPEQLGRMIAYFDTQPVLGPGGVEVALDTLPAGTPAAAYSLDRVLRCPGMLQLLNAPSILSILADYLGCEPTLSSVGVRWSFPGAAATTATQAFHRDLDDWRFLKLFVYLTDVDEGGGPHCYVRGSHTTGFGWRAKHYRRIDLERRFGQDRLSLVVGPRGTTFMADTLGIHCGVAPAVRPRLILQVQYSLLPVFAFRYARPTREGPAAAAYCNRLILRPPTAA